MNDILHFVERPLVINFHEKRQLVFYSTVFNFKYSPLHVLIDCFLWILFYKHFCFFISVSYLFIYFFLFGFN